MQDIEEVVNDRRKRENIKGEKCDLKKLYRSENGRGRGRGNYIFFDTSEIMEYKQKLDNAFPSLHKYWEVLDSCPPNIREYETSTYDSLKFIFEIWKHKEYLTYDELKKIEKKLKNLLPRCRNIDQETEILKSGNYKLYMKLEDQYENEKHTIEECIFIYYIKIIEDRFANAPFSKDHYMKNKQIDLVKNWKEKWTYVIDNIAFIYENTNEINLSISDIMDVLLVWCENEKRSTIALSNELLQNLKEKIHHEIKSKQKDKLIKDLDNIIEEYKKTVVKAIKNPTPQLPAQ